MKTRKQEFQGGTTEREMLYSINNHLTLKQNTWFVWSWHSPTYCVTYSEIKSPWLGPHVMLPVAACCLLLQSQTGASPLPRLGTILLLSHRTQPTHVSLLKVGLPSVPELGTHFLSKHALFFLWNIYQHVWLYICVIIFLFLRACVQWVI